MAGEPWSRQPAEGEMLAMAIGAVLWGTSNVASERGRTVTKTRHIGVRYGYENLKRNPKSPMFQQAGGSGLTLRSYQDVICVNQWGRRFWNEMDDTYGFLNACLSRHENGGRTGRRTAAVQSGDLRRRCGGARAMDRRPPTSIRTAGSTVPTPSPNWRAGLPTCTSSSRWRRASSRRRWRSTTGTSTRAGTRNLAGPT